MKFLTEFLDMINIGFIIFDLNEKVYFKNKQALQFIDDYTADQNAYPEKKLEDYMSFLIRLIYKKGIVKIDLSEDDSKVYLLSHTQISKQNKIYGISIYNYSIISSEMHYDFDAFIPNTSYQEFASILDSAKDAIIIDDDKGTTLWVNKAGEDLYGVDRKDIIGKNVEILEELGIFSPSVARLAIEKKKAVSILHSNKKGKKLLTTGTPIFNKEGKIKKIISTSRDTTELIQLKNQLEDVQMALDELQVQKKVFHGDIIANSPNMYNILQLSKRLAQIDSTILITGESGVGKGVVSKYLHDSGQRKNDPFIKVNCGAIPETLIESELFGYESGAFTGSRKDGKKGMFELAHNGTIFLDEIGELPLHLQVKILQVIQDKEIQRVGGVTTIAVNVRIIAATNKDLNAMVNEGKFREDLFYRLNVVPINIPPLRERQEDIIPLVRHFLQKYNKKFSEQKRIDPNTMGSLIKYNWPGNVRELENIIERIIITTKGNTILPNHLPSYILKSSNDTSDINISKVISLKNSLEETEKQILINTARKYSTTRQIAKVLGISQPSVVRKLHKYGITTTASD